MWDKGECEHQTARFCLGIPWNLKYYSFYLYSLQGFLSLSSFLSLHLTFTTFRCVLIYSSTVPSCLSSSILIAPVHCRLSSPEKGANPHLPPYLQLLPSRIRTPKWQRDSHHAKRQALKLDSENRKLRGSPCFGLNGILDIGERCTTQQCHCTAIRQRRCVGSSFWETPFWVNMWQGAYDRRG